MSVAPPALRERLCEKSHSADRRFSATVLGEPAMGVPVFDRDAAKEWLVDDRFLASAALEGDHRQIDGGLAQLHAGLANGDWRAAPFAAAAARLRRHIYIEEDVLFPELRRAGMFAPVTVMIREHGEIWRALDAIEDALREDADVAAALTASTRLHTVLEAHNSKEEQILYPAADRALSPEATSRLQHAIEHGVLPDAWLCEVLREETDSGNSPGSR